MSLVLAYAQVHAEVFSAPMACVVVHTEVWTVPMVCAPALAEVGISPSFSRLSSESAGGFIFEGDFSLGISIGDLVGPLRVMVSGSNFNFGNFISTYPHINGSLKSRGRIFVEIGGFRKCILPNFRKC